MYLLYTLLFVFRNVQVLVEKNNCNMVSEDNDGMTPLHIACKKGHTKVVEILLGRETDVDHKNAQGSTPLNLAVRAEHKEIVRLLLSK